MKKLTIAVAAMLFSTSLWANWEGLTEENYACGPKLTPSQLRGKVVLVDMWATWCGPCRNVMPHTVEIAKKYKARGLVAIGSHVSNGYSKDGVATLAQGQGWDISFYKEARWTGDSIGFDGGIPFLYVVNKKGKIVARGRNFGEIEQAIVESLNAAGGANFMNNDELVEYKDLKAKLLPGKNVEPILKRLKKDVEQANKNPSSSTFAKRKAEALKIAKAVKEYKSDLMEGINASIESGEKEEAIKSIDLLIATWPSMKGEWAAKKKALGK